VHNKTKLNWNLVVLNNYFILVMLGILQTIVAKRVTCRGAQYGFMQSDSSICRLGINNQTHINENYKLNYKN